MPPIIVMLEFVMNERSIRGGAVNKVFLLVAVDTFVLVLPTPQILRPSLMASRMTV
jgi:hypothetical protein